MAEVFVRSDCQYHLIQYFSLICFIALFCVEITEINVMIGAHQVILLLSELFVVDEVFIVCCMAKKFCKFWFYVHIFVRIICRCVC